LWSASEAAEDLEQIVSLVDTAYGSYEYKEARFGYRPGQRRESVAACRERRRARTTALSASRCR
jgi:hypothetical protein